MNTKITAKVTEIERLFIEETLKTNRIAASYKKFYNCEGLSLSRIRVKASQLWKNPRIVSYTNNIRRRTRDHVIYTYQDVLLDLLDIATCDPNELVQLRRNCCRFCHGNDHRYQWLDDDEIRSAQILAIDKNFPMPDTSGGVGFDHSLYPIDTCPNCRGEGIASVFICDTRTLSPQARKLYAGVKQTKDGVQVLMRDQDAALRDFGKAIGMWKEALEISAPGGGPVAIALPVDANEAARFYAEFVKRRPTA